MSATQPPDDSGRTVLPRRTGAETQSTSPGFKVGTQNALPAGTRLGEFEIKGLIGAGGFGIVYLAYDHSLQRQVALKEYMPSELAGRDGGATVTVKSERHIETFQAGLRSFVNEARLLAQFDHPSLVKVYRFWESNGTAYMVMPFYEGITLKETLSRLGNAPDEAWLKALLAQLLDALNIIHEDSCLHRDVSPDNILILPDGRPLLLDFGAARRVIGSMTQTFTVILKPGYAPIEQYAEAATMKQGPWTDIYAVGAVTYFAIMGHAPVPSISRMMSDSLVPLSEAAEGRYSAAFLKAIDRALAIKPGDRLQSVIELRAALGLNGKQKEPSAYETSDRASTKNNQKPPASSNKPGKSYITAFATLLVGIGVIGTVTYLMRDKPTEVAPMPAPARKDLTVPPPVTEKKQFDPLKALDEIFKGRARDHAVTVSTGKAQARIGKDLLRFRVRSARTGYVYVLMVGTNRSDFFLLFPNLVDKSNIIKAGKELELPRARWKMLAEGPPGTNHFVVIVSDHPRDFSAAGLKTVDPFAVFPVEDAARLYETHTLSLPLFAGKPICPPSVSRCSESYGAAVFSIEEI